jgi:hypothetical protein
MNATKQVITKLLPCSLSTQELTEKRDELASVVVEYDKVEQRKKEDTSVLSEEMKRLRARSSQLSKQINSRTEERSVECLVQHDNVTCTVETIRTDTGEILEAREMTPAERQQVLDLPVGLVRTKKPVKGEA